MEGCSLSCPHESNFLARRMVGYGTFGVLRAERMLDSCCLSSEQLCKQRH